MTNVPWPEAQTTRLHELHTQGYSGGKISAILTEEFGMLISRNAVRGKIHRLKLPSPHQPRWATSARRSKKQAPTPILVWDEPTNPKISLRDSNGDHCRFIAGDANGPDTLFCSAPAVYRSFCVYHAGICYRPPTAPVPRAWQPRPPRQAAE